MTTAPSDPAKTPVAPGKARARIPRRLLQEFTSPGLVHPALIPGVGVERTGKTFATNWLVLSIAAFAVLIVVLWSFLSPESMGTSGQAALAWVTANFGWLFSILAIAVTMFMFVVGYGRTGGIRLGADDEAPEFSTVSWIAMLFSAGMGIGLLFWGPAEPLSFFLDVPYGFDAEAGTLDAMHTALAQASLHWGPLAWGFYALVGGAIAYAAYRRGRAPLISAIFEPIFGQKTDGPLGAVVDIFAIIVTLFGTAVTLGMGALQIGRGVEIISGAGPLGNGFLIATIAVLTGMFVVSAVSGIKRGIRLLSNINMVLAGLIGLFIFIAGPTLLLINLIPAASVTFFAELGTMLSRSSAMGEDAGAFVDSWTNYYWAWWISWTPFVGMFIAKISRGRTLREFVTVVIVVPAAVCMTWFGIVGGTTMWLEMQGAGMSTTGSSEGVLFAMLGELPFGIITSVVAMVSIVLFFVTSADSAAIVMGSMSQRGRPEPSTWVTIAWGVLLGAAALALLLVGGQTALSGLQSIMVVTALPFAFIVIGIMIAWAKDLRTDPFILRRKYASEAIAQGVRMGIAEHGDDFVFGTSAVAEDRGAGAWLDSEDPALTEWYTDTSTGAIEIVTTEDVQRGFDPEGDHTPKEQPDGDSKRDASAASSTSD